MRQAMTNGARFTTPELAELDRRISEAAERAAAREALVFASLVRAVLAQADALAACAAALARLDVLQSCARLAEGGRWCRPAGHRQRRVLHPRRPASGGAGRARRAAAFVPNDCDLSPARRVLLLTGPNMAGKSTYLRQNALAAILAQAGLPVPAESAEIGVVDRLFSRVGAADDLARGRSTFMVEMTETAAILHQAGPALAGRGRRDRPRHQHAGRAGDRLGGAGGAARADPLPHDLRHAFPRARALGGADAAALPAYDAGQGVAGQRRVPARGGGGGGGAELGRACGRAGRRAGADRAPRRRACWRRWRRAAMAMPAELPLFAALETSRQIQARTSCVTRSPPSIPTD